MFRSLRAQSGKESPKDCFAGEVRTARGGGFSPSRHPAAFLLPHLETATYTEDACSVLPKPEWAENYSLKSWPFPICQESAWLGFNLGCCTSSYRSLPPYVERVCLWIYTHCAFVYFYICILHSNRDFMHRIKLFPPNFPRFIVLLNNSATIWTSWTFAW